MILLAAPDESSLAAKKKQRHVALETATSTPKNRVWNFENGALGRPVVETQISSETATGSVQFSYETASGRAYYYTRDHLGSVREMLNSSGTIVARYSYDAFGNTTLVSGSNLATYQFAEMMMHQPSGLYLPMLRGGYDSILGRFIQRDLMAENGGINQYEYSDNEPINEYDPLGLDAVIVIHRAVPAPGQPQRDAPGMAIIFENSKCIGTTTCNANGYYPGTHGLYPGTYNVLPRTNYQPGDHFPNGTPGVTAPGNTTPGDAGHGYHNVYIHYALKPGQGPDSEGCITVPTAPTDWPKEIQDLVNRNLNNGGTTLIIIFDKPNSPVPQPVK